jgi:hypothetical protein
MSNTNSINSTDELFTDLAPAQAEVVEGGLGPVKIPKTRVAMNYYRDAFFQVRLGASNTSRPTLKPNVNNQISSVIIDRGVWDFYDGVARRGRRLVTLTPGVWSYVGDVANDKISSFFRRRGT